jgi:hypothetical protein
MADVSVSVANSPKSVRVDLERGHSTDQAGARHRKLACGPRDHAFACRESLFDDLFFERIEAGRPLAELLPTNLNVVSRGDRWL